jgi:hypothetical protein
MEQKTKAMKGEEETKEKDDIPNSKLSVDIIKGVIAEFRPWFTSSADKIGVYEGDDYMYCGSVAKMQSGISVMMPRFCLFVDVFKRQGKRIVKIDAGYHLGWGSMCEAEFSDKTTLRKAIKTVWSAYDNYLTGPKAGDDPSKFAAYKASQQT